MSKCFNCGEKKPEGRIFCKKCDEERESGELVLPAGEVLIIYDKI